MLEILRILSKQPHLNENSIIFLFNGGEEFGLQGAHGFITQHPWAIDINGNMVTFQSIECFLWQNLYFFYPLLLNSLHKYGFWWIKW